MVVRTQSPGSRVDRRKRDEDMEVSGRKYIPGLTRRTSRLVSCSEGTNFEKLPYSSTNFILDLGVVSGVSGDTGRGVGTGSTLRKRRRDLPKQVWSPGNENDDGNGLKEKGL